MFQALSFGDVVFGYRHGGFILEVFLIYFRAALSCFVLVYMCYLM